MKYKTLLISILFVFLSVNCIGQDESKYKLRTSNEVLQIKRPGYDLHIYEVISNQYGEFGKSSGSKFVEIEGYRLAEGLKVLANYADKTIKITNLRSNPYIKWRIESIDDFVLPRQFDAVLKELSIVYKFSIDTKQVEILNYNFKVVDRSLLENHFTKKVKMGVVGEASLQKSSSWILTNSTLHYLKDWIKDTYFINIEKLESKDPKFYDFYFVKSDLESVISDLKIKYGIELNGKKILKTGYIIQ